MKKTTILVSLIVFASSAFAQYNSKNLSISASGDQTFSYENLRIFPIRANQEFFNTFKSVGTFLTLSKALDEKKVIITEAVDTIRRNTQPIYQNQQSNTHNQQNQSSNYSGESVNKLFIENVSGDTVLVLTGEVVKGGKQNRMVSQNFLLPPHSGNKDLSVFCVEHGRWTYNNEQSLNGSAKFSSNHHYSSNKMRKVAIVDKSQQLVWNEVNNVTKKNDAVSNSSTYTALEESKEYQKNLDAYISYFKNAVKDQNDIIGFLACSGDSIIGCDMFATREMFLGQLDNLLQSYSTEAITNGSKVKVPKEKAQEYLDKFLTDESTQDAEINKSGTILKNQGRKLVISKF